MIQKTLLSYGLTFNDVVELIKNGADTNEEGEYGYTPLFYATTVEIAQLLIEHGSDINHKNNDGYTLIHWPKHVKIIKLLIKNGIKLNTLSDTGLSPADSNLDISNLKILINHGSIPTKIEKYKLHRDLFTKEQQKAFDTFMSITNNDNDFFQMCLAYQNDKENLERGLRFKDKNNYIKNDHLLSNKLRAAYQTVSILNDDPDDFFESLLKIERENIVDIQELYGSLTNQITDSL